MKNIILVLLLFIGFIGKGQVKATVPARQLLTPKPVYLIDSIKVDERYLKYIDPEEIASLNVFKDALNYHDGAVFIQLKEKGLLERLMHSKWLSLGEIAGQNIKVADKQKPVLYLVDEKLLTDTSNVRIPVICLNKVSIVKASETEYFKTALPDVLIMMIATKPLSDKPPSVIIRGDAAVATNPR